MYAQYGRFPIFMQSGLFGQQINHFYINNYFGFYDRDDYTHVTEIVTALRVNNWHPELINNRRIRVDSGTFFLSSRPVVSPRHAVEGYDWRDGLWYVLFYVDATDISRFSGRVNMILLLLVGIIWSAAMVIATFLAGSLAWPLHVLSGFARRIGQGDFSPNPEEFSNDEFEILNRNLNFAAKQLAKYDNDQKAFFQNMSHDLRTPLMSIKSYAEGIKYGIMDAQTASETILTATNRLTDMVGDILYVSRIDNITAPNKEEMDIYALVSERVNFYDAMARDKVIKFRHGGEPIMAQCIKAYLERAVDNLISNALRYAQTTVTITCGVEKNHVVICVADDGPGFEPNDIPHVFERFYRGKSGITGIGLAIVKSIIDQHGGTTTAENKERGASLTIAIPCTGNPK